MRDPEEVRRRQEFAEKILERTFREAKEEDRRRRQQVEEAIAANPEKEPFSIERLGQFYSLSNGSFVSPSDYSPSERVVEDYRYDYYVRYPETNTVRELAKILYWHDSHEAN